MILTFSITSKLSAKKGVPDPLLSGQKTVSRRTWKEVTARKWINAYLKGRRVHQAWTASPYVPGARPLGTFLLTCEPYREALENMPEADLLAEGGLWDTREQFIQDVNGGDPTAIVWVIRWKDFNPHPVNVPE